MSMFTLLPALIRKFPPIFKKYLRLHLPASPKVKYRGALVNMEEGAETTGPWLWATAPSETNPWLCFSRGSSLIYPLRNGPGGGRERGGAGTRSHLADGFCVPKYEVSISPQSEVRSHLLRSCCKINRVTSTLFQRRVACSCRNGRYFVPRVYVTGRQGGGATGLFQPWPGE